MTKILFLAAGSLAGGFSRYYLAGFAQRCFGSSFPYGTLVVNLAGCFLIGFLSAVADEKFLLGPEGRVLMMTGFCGAFTTFSTFMLETGNLLKDGELFRAFLNVALSLAAGFIVFKIGVVIGEVV
ncbi:MAG TPA: fluoride efflux transporter CrcB [Candidatus Eisenbacteria bacterium]|nr:fluoride efflux transporter CrcB [Candidatus Eisenbacteria bacterium]